MMTSHGTFRMSLRETTMKDVFSEYIPLDDSSYITGANLDINGGLFFS